MRPLATIISPIRFISRSLGGFMTALDLIAVITAVIAVTWPSSTISQFALAALALLTLGRVIRDVVQKLDPATPASLHLGTKPLSRILIVVAALAVGTTDGEHRSLTALAAMSLVVLVVGEKAIRRPLQSAAPQVANLPGWEVPIPSPTLANYYFVATTTGVTLLAIGAVFDVTPIPVLAAAAVGVVLAVLVGLQSAKFLVRRNRFETQLPKILKQLGPVFAFHWQAPGGTAYQAAMWLPYLERLGVPYFILARTKVNFHELEALTDAPVILRTGLEDLDPIVCPSLKVVFYANTAVRNSHMIRFPHLTHIQLNHGDSDKIASVSPTFRQYDKNFVAGQAAIDRFDKHGVATIPNQFEIVGRPQLENVEPAKRPIGKVDGPTVLYSPTWSGFYDDSDYSSLSAGPALVQELLDRGCTVIFRPHPYARRHKANSRACDEIIARLTSDAAESGRPHLFGPVAETEMSVFDCFNASDAMVSDVSSVVSDFLISGKPFAMTAVSAHGEEFVEEFPMARAAYVIDVHADEPTELGARLDAMLGDDPLAEVRASLRTYYLSDTPPDRIAERFVDVARRYL